MKGEKNKINDVKITNTGQLRGNWMAPGIGVGAALGILFGNYVLSPAMGSQTTGYILGMSTGVAIGLVSGLSLSSGQSHKTVNKEEKEN